MHSGVSSQAAHRNGLMELEFSRSTLYAMGAVIILTLLSFLGRAVTPIDGDGQPLVLSPAYVATVRYLKTAQGWLDRLAQIDADLTEVMEAQGNIYTQGRDAERAFEKALVIAREVEQGKAPPSLASLQAALTQSAHACVQAARAALLYVSAPSAENRQAVDEALDAARGKLESCQAQREELWPAS
jgi:hypothetical protein